VPTKIDQADARKLAEVLYKAYPSGHAPTVCDFSHSLALSADTLLSPAPKRTQTRLGTPRSDDRSALVLP
jgi:hypothetical protein